MANRELLPFFLYLNNGNLLVSYPIASSRSINDDSAGAWRSTLRYWATLNPAEKVKEGKQ